MDGESGISHFSVSVGGFPGDDSMYTAKEYDNSTNQVLLSISPADLFPATTIFISVGCVNRAGLMNSVFTEVKVDSTPPIPGRVLDVDPRAGAFAMDIDEHDHSRLKAVWDPFLDSECPISRYQVALVESRFDMTILSSSITWFDAQAHVYMMLPQTLLRGETYKILVRAFTTAGLSTVAASDGVTFVRDQYQPAVGPQISAGKIMIQSKDQSETFNGWLGLDQELLVKWQGFKGALFLFDVGIGGSPGVDDVITFRSFPANASSALLKGPFRIGTLYVTVLAWSDAGESVAASAVMKVDTSPPFAGKVFEVDPGRDNFADIDCFMSSSLEIKILWDAFADFESGIERYEVALIRQMQLISETILLNSSGSFLHSTRQGLENSTRWYPAGNSTSLIISSALLPMKNYYAVVRGWNRAHLHSDAFSNGFYVVEKEIEAEVIDGDGDGSEDSDFISSSDELEGRAIIKNVGEVGGLVSSVECGFGTTPFGFQIQQLRAANITTVSTVHGKALEMVICRSDRLKNIVQAVQGSKVFVCVKITTCWGHSKLFVSNGALVDITPPSFLSSSARIYDAAMILPSHLNHTQNFTIAWDGITDRESGVIEYEVGIFSLTGSGTYVKTQTSRSAEFSAYSLSLQSGTFLVKLRATNGAGLMSERDLMHFTIDSSPPIATSGLVRHEAGTSNAEGCQSSTSTLRFSWQRCTDEESHILSYYYAVVEESQLGVSNSRAWKSVGLVTYAIASGLKLEYNSSYRVFVRCENAAKLVTEMRSSSILVTNLTPEILILEHSFAYLSQSTPLTASGIASMENGFIIGADCGFGFSPVLARADAEHTKWKAHVTNFSRSHYNISCEIRGIQLRHMSQYFFFLKVKLVLKYKYLAGYLY
jgi:hypothetical protein